MSKKQKLCIQLFERRERRTGAGDDDQRKIRFVLIRAAENVYVRKEKAHAWLNIPSQRLSDHTPMDMLVTADGRNEVRELLVQIDEGIFTLI